MNKGQSKHSESQVEFLPSSDAAVLTVMHDGFME